MIRKILFVMVVLLGLLVVACGGRDTGPPEATPEPAAETEDLTVEIPAEGIELDPPIEVAKLPPGAWYCDMGTTHYARPDEGDGECPVCGMTLVQNTQ